MSAAETMSIDDVDGLRAALSNVAQTNDPNTLIEIVISLLLRLSNENKSLQLRLQKALRGLHGGKSEKLTSAQLALFREIIESNDDKDADNDCAKAREERKEKNRRQAKPHGRGKFPDHLKRVDNVIAVSDAERICGVCGGVKQCIGHDVSERLDYVPALLRVIRDMREKVACKPCQGSVSVAPAADKVVEGGMASEALLAHVLTSKFVDGLTLTRLSKIYARQGVHLAESTLGDFVRDATGALAGVARHIETQVLASRCINQDDSGLRVLDSDHAKGIKRGHIWVFAAEARWAAYRYTPDWKGKHPRAFLEGYSGYIQGDGYAGINGLFGGDNSPTRVGCWMHCRRYFFDAHKAGDTRAAIALAYIHDIYDVERAAKDQNASTEQRLAMRQEQSLPLVKKLGAWIDDVAGRSPPKTDLGKAVTYARNQWQSLLVPFSDAQLEIDNGEAERRLKVLATGRKNWLFAGSDKGAERAAIALTVLGTAVLQGVDPLGYVTDTLRKIAGGWGASRVAELMPTVWAAQEGQQVQANKPVIPRFVE